MGQGTVKLLARESTALRLALNSVEDASLTSCNLRVGYCVLEPLHAPTKLVTSLLQLEEGAGGVT